MMGEWHNDMNTVRCIWINVLIEKQKHKSHNIHQVHVYENGHYVRQEIVMIKTENGYRVSTTYEY